MTMLDLVVTNCVNRRHRPRTRARGRSHCDICERAGHGKDAIVSYATWKPWKEDHN